MSDAVFQFLTLARRTVLENWRFCRVCNAKTEHRPYTSLRTQAHGWQCLTCGDIHDLSAAGEAETHA